MILKIIIEGLILGALLWLYCAIGIRDGAVCTDCFNAYGRNYGIRTGNRVGWKSGSPRCAPV